MQQMKQRNSVEKFSSLYETSRKNELEFLNTQDSCEDLERPTLIGECTKRPVHAPVSSKRKLRTRCTLNETLERFAMQCRRSEFAALGFIK